MIPEQQLVQALPQQTSAVMGADAQQQDGAAAASFSGRTRTNLKKGSSKALTMLPPEEARVRAIAEVVNSLIQGVQEGRDVDLNELKSQVRG